MKVKASFTVDVSDLDRANFAVALGRWPNRDDLKEVLEKGGTTALRHYQGKAKSQTVAELSEIGVPAEVIVEDVFRGPERVADE